MPIFDNGVLLVAALALAVVGGAAVWAVLRKNLPPGLLTEIGAIAASIRAQLGDSITEERVRAFAAVLYDQWGHGSQYVGRERFCDLVWEAVKRSLDVDSDAIMALSSLSGE